MANRLMAHDARSASDAVTLTFLRAPGKTLTKSYRRSRQGTIVKTSAPHAMWFSVRQEAVNDFASFSASLLDVERRPDQCLIRGIPGPLRPRDGEPVMRRLHHEHSFFLPEQRLVHIQTGGRAPSAYAERLLAGAVRRASDPVGNARYRRRRKL